MEVDLIHIIEYINSSRCVRTYKAGKWRALHTFIVPTYRTSSTTSPPLPSSPLNWTARLRPVSDSSTIREDSIAETNSSGWRALETRAFHRSPWDRRGVVSGGLTGVVVETQIKTILNYVRLYGGQTETQVW